jgi:hypothetical protein
MPDSIGCVAGENEAGRTPPTAEQAPRAQTQAQTTTALQEPGGDRPSAGQPSGVAEQPAGSGQGEPPANPSPGMAEPRAGQPSATGEHSGQPPAAEPEQGEQPAAKPGFGERGRMRRRARFLRKARELAYRDLGGLVYDLHRFGQRNDPVVLAKLATLGHIDAELRALEQALHEIKPVTVLREVGIAACPRCAAIHGHEDRFCPGCGLAFGAGADRPLSTAPVTPTAQPGTDAAEPAGADAAAPGAASPATAAAPAPGAAPTPGLGGGAAPASGLAPGAPRPAGEPLTTIERPREPSKRPHEQPPASPLRPTATPVAARPSAPEDGEDKPHPEDEPTQILRPPTESP